MRPFPSDSTLGRVDQPFGKATPLLFWIATGALLLIGIALLIAADITKRDAFGFIGGAIVVLTLLYLIASHAPLF